jgi:hypothetical protein
MSREEVSHPKIAVNSATLSTLPTGTKRDLAKLTFKPEENKNDIGIMSRITHLNPKGVVSYMLPMRVAKGDCPITLQ